MPRIREVHLASPWIHRLAMARHRRHTEQTAARSPTKTMAFHSLTSLCCNKYAKIQPPPQSLPQSTTKLHSTPSSASLSSASASTAPQASQMHGFTKSCAPLQPLQAFASQRVAASSSTPHGSWHHSCLFTLKSSSSKGSVTAHHRSVSITTLTYCKY